MSSISVIHHPVGVSAPDYGSESGSTADGGTDISDKDSDAGESEEMHTLGDASSTATVGSNPAPFFSDQVCGLVIVCVCVCVYTSG